MGKLVPRLAEILVAKSVDGNMTIGVISCQKVGLCYHVSMKWLKKIMASGETEVKSVEAPSVRQVKVENAAKDFAVRFEGVMKDLANS